MSIQTYDTHVLAGVIRNLPPVRTFWLDLAFPVVKTFEDEFIDFDVVTKGRRLAPFVSPMAQGKVMKSEGMSTKRFKPAYVKPKMVVDPRRVLKRRAGEAFGGAMSPQARRDAIVADMLSDQQEMHTRRREWMAAQAIINGAVTVAGDDYPSVSVDFGRKTNHTVTLTGGACWGQAGVSIIDLLETWQARVLLDCGYAPTHLVMGTTAWGVFRKDAEVKAEMDVLLRGTTGDLAVGLGSGEAVQYKGRVGQLQVWVYNDIYDDDSGTSQPMMDQKTAVLLNPAGVQGVRAFGAIMDAEAGYISTDIYPKNWFSKDPSVEYLMTQSAPLMIPGQPDAVLTAKVLD